MSNSFKVGDIVVVGFRTKKLAIVTEVFGSGLAYEQVYVRILSNNLHARFLTYLVRHPDPFLASMMREQIKSCASPGSVIKLKKTAYEKIQ
jgi:hypothetical protein